MFMNALNNGNSKKDDSKAFNIHISNIKSLRILNHDEFLSIKKVISSTSSKYYLKSVELHVCSFDDAAEILDLLSDWINLDSVELRYKLFSNFIITKNNLINEIREAIRELKNKFYKNAGIICKLSIC